MSGPYKCTKIKCDRSFPSECARKEHSAKPHKICEFCDVSFLTQGLPIHQKRCHKNITYTTCVCGEKIDTKQLILHQIRCEAYKSSKKKQAVDSTPICSGCKKPVAVGMHYLTIPFVEFHSMMPQGYVPVRRVEPTVIEDLVICSSACIVRWAMEDELIIDVFEDLFASLRRYQMVIHGKVEWVVAQQAGYSLCSVPHSCSLGNLVREPDGLERRITDQETEQIRSMYMKVRV